jgi:glycosyltransferase involved in cell wall biosynthesis
MRAKVEKDAIPDVIFAGFLNQSEVARAYACADVFALLSRENETFGLVTNEAMNFSLPVLVSSKVGCAPDLVSHGLNGFIAPAHDCEAAAGMLRTLAGDEALRLRMGAESLKRIDTWTGQRAADGVLAATAHAVGPTRWQAALSP